MRSIKYFALLSILFFASEAHSQAYTVKNLDCAKIVQTLTTKVSEIVLTVDVADPAQIQSNDSLASFLDTAFKDAVQTCRTRGMTTASWIEIDIWTGDVFLYQGEMSARTRQWKARQDARGWQIPAILKRRQDAEAEARAETQAVDQAALCALETNANLAEQRATAAFDAESNPMKKETLRQELQQVQRQDYIARLNFFRVKWGAFSGPNGLIVVQQQARNFASFTGRLTQFDVLSAIQAVDLTVVLDCDKYRISVSTRAFPNSTYTPLPSHLEILRPMLEQVNKGDAVAISGAFVLSSANPISPAMQNGETSYAVRIDSIQKR